MASPRKLIAAAVLLVLAALGWSARGFLTDQAAPSAGLKQAPNQWNSPSPRYLKADKTLGRPAPGVTRVVFFGDSIVEQWDLPGDFSGAGIEAVNRGIGGQTTGQMRLRLRQDALYLTPAAVVIIGGANDPSFGVSAEQTIKNISAMARLAHDSGAAVIIGTLWSPPTDDTRRINQAVKELCAGGTCVVADFEKAFCHGGRCDADRFVDSIHPNPSGYQLMTGVAQKAFKITR